MGNLHEQLLDVGIFYNGEYMFDYFCVGSDQVWNFNWYADINYFKN